MCEKAEDVQKKWKPKEWDYHYGIKNSTCDNEGIVWCIVPDRISDSGYYGISPENFDEEGKDRYDKIIWLPRQDQLQEMIGRNQVKYFYTDFGEYQSEKLKNHWELYREPHENEQYRYDGDSIEQCFLRVIMKEKYNKIWDNENWT